MELLWFFLAALFAEVVGTVAGFGSSTIFMPLALFFVEFRVALIFVALFHVAGNLAKSVFFRRGFDWRLFLRFGIPSVFLTIAGALLVAVVAQDVLKFVLGLFLLAFSLWSLHDGVVLPRAKWVTVLGGCLSGFFAGLLGTGGAFRAAVLSSLRLRKDAYIMMNAVIAVLVDVTRIPVYIGSGFLPSGWLPIVLGLVAIAILGALIGKRIVDVLPQKAFRIIVVLAIGLVGLKFVFDFLR